MPSWKKVIVSGSAASLSSLTTSGNISGSSTSTGSFGKLEIAENALVSNRLGIGLATSPDQPLHVKVNNSNSDPHFFIENTNASGRSHARFWNSSRNTYWSFVKIMIIILRLLTTLTLAII